MQPWLWVLLLRDCFPLPLTDRSLIGTLECVDFGVLADTSDGIDLADALIDTGLFHV